jgi:hypothetical protein
MRELEQLAQQFAGLDVQFRRDLPVGWAGLWRVRQSVSKNERAAYRLEAFGATLPEAVAALAELVRAVDGDA